MLVGKVREFLAEQMPLDEAIDSAVVWCIKNDYMVEYLRKHRAEVTDMWLTEFNEEEYKEAMKEEGREEGLTQGRAEEHARGIVSSVEAIMSSLGLSLEDACKALNTTVEEYNSAKAQIELN